MLHSFFCRDPAVGFKKTNDISGGSQMTRSAWAVLFLLAFTPPAWSQTTTASLNDAQRLGQRLFVQSCGICHVNVQQRAALYGPALSQASLGGQDDVLREVISNGTPRMPGFKHHFERAEIDAIVAYLKTVPAQPR
jgi:mono/diheme cytochrome c family protein